MCTLEYDVVGCFVAARHTNTTTVRRARVEDGAGCGVDGGRDICVCVARPTHTTEATALME